MAEDFRPEYRCKSKRTKINIALKTCFGELPKDNLELGFISLNALVKPQKKESILDVFPQTSQINDNMTIHYCSKWG